MWRHTLQPQALNLVRVLPVDNATWLTARISTFPKLTSPTRYWAELRDDVFILYPAAQLYAEHQRLYVARPPDFAHDLDAVPTPKHLEALPFALLSVLAERVPSSHAHAFVLPSLRLTCREQTCTIQLKTHRLRPAARVLLDSAASLAEWREAFNRAIFCDRKRLSDFRIIRHVGKGASGRVYLVEDKITSESYALKVIEKTTVFESKDTYRHAMDERLVLQMIRHHPYILDMHYAFQNSKRLFLVTEFCPSGDLFEYMNRRVAPLDERSARFVSAQVLLALGHLHELGVVYRDLKLENILIDHDGHIRLADFGLTKVLRQPDGTLNRTNTFCGTREYVAPEMLRGESYDMSLDFWTFGILLYEMLSGRTPFYSSDHSEIYKRIEKMPLSYPRNLSSEVRNLISKLLARDPKKRIGGRDGIAAIKKHAWYKGVDWDHMYDRASLESPLKKSLVFLRREDAGRSGYISPLLLAKRKGRKEQKQEKALANVLADVQADLRYASTRLNDPPSRRGCGSLSGSLLGRPRSRADVTGDIVLAGYSFCDPRRRAISEDVGAFRQTSKSALLSSRWTCDDRTNFEMDDTRYSLGDQSGFLPSARAFSEGI